MKTTAHPHSLIFDNMLQAVIICTQHLEITYLNSQAVAMFDLTAEAAIGKPITSLAAFTENKEFLHSIERLSPLTIDLEITKADHKKIFLQCVMEKTEEGFVFFFNDVTENRKKIEELLMANAQLELFAFEASHDLQEPLRTITGFLRLLEDELNSQLNDTSRQYMNYAIDGAERMKRIIENLLEYARIGSGTENFAMVDTNEIVNGVVESLQAHIHETNTHITLQQLPSVYAVDSNMHQLFQNLISNAIKFRNKNTVPEIEIGYTENEKDFIFHVKDNGIGIDEKFFERIFHVFKRLHSKSKYPGTGIGLAICKKIIENHNGTIWIESEPGKGSCFYFTLPKK